MIHEKTGISLQAYFFRRKKWLMRENIFHLLSAKQVILHTSEFILFAEANMTTRPPHKDKQTNKQKNPDINLFVQYVIYAMGSYKITDKGPAKLKSTTTT